MTVNQYIKPEGLYRPHGFAHATVSTGSRIAHISGQISVDTTMNLQHPGDHRAQADLAVRNFATAVRATGAALGDVAKMGIYIVDYTPQTHEAVFAGFTDAVLDIKLRVPSLVVLGVATLAIEGALVEIDGTAHF